MMDAAYSCPRSRSMVSCRQPLLDAILPGVRALAVLVEDVGVVPGIPAGAVGAVLLDQVRAFAEPPVVLGVVPAGLGDVVVEVQEHLVAHLFFVVDLLVFRDRLADQRDRRPCRSTRT